MLWVKHVWCYWFVKHRLHCQYIKSLHPKFTMKVGSHLMIVCKKNTWHWSINKQCILLSIKGQIVNAASCYVTKSMKTRQEALQLFCKHTTFDLNVRIQFLYLANALWSTIKCSLINHSIYFDYGSWSKVHVNVHK